MEGQHNDCGALMVVATKETRVFHSYCEVTMSSSITQRTRPPFTQRIILTNNAVVSIGTIDQNEAQEDTSLQLQGIQEPHENDVLMGRGGKNNQHIGNEKLRDLARERCDKYHIASKKGKSEISRELVRLVREMKPPGR